MCTKYIISFHVSAEIVAQQPLLTARREAVSPLSYRISNVGACSGVLHQGSTKSFLIIRAENMHQMFSGNCFVYKKFQLKQKVECIYSKVCLLLLTHKGQRHNWQQRDWDRCFHDRTKRGKREAHCISL